MPQDPASGAARSLRTMSLMLARSGRADVRALATTASEGGPLPAAFLAELGMLVSRRGEVLSFEDGGIATTLLPVDELPYDLSPQSQERLTGHLQAELSSWRPDVLLTYGGFPEDVERRLLAREAGAKVVFGLRNLGYLQAGQGFFTPAGGIDFVLACSEFVVSKYRTALGVESTSLPIPMDEEDVVWKGEAEPMFVTYINPSLAKGVMFFVRLADELASRRPDIPFLVVESRGRTGTLLEAAERSGIDLTRHDNIMVTGDVPNPKSIYAISRLVLAPSAWEEPAGRVGAEALLNGISPIVSNRGGLPEVVEGGGFVLPLPKAILEDHMAVVQTGDTITWSDLIERLCDDDRLYGEAQARARQAGERYRWDALAPRYVDYFERAAGDLPP